MNQWKEYKLGGIVKTNLKSIDKTYTHTVIEYLDTGSITQGKIEGYQIFSLIDAPSRARRLVQENDIIYSSVRPIQRHYGIIKNSSPNLVVSTGFVVITCNQELASPKYIYYFLKNDEMVNYLDMVAEASTSTYPSLKPSDIEDVDILLPPLPEQRAIASILSSLDDKIDLLHRQNATLEALAETLFRQWFVEEAEESWEDGFVGDLFTLQRGFDLPAQNRIEGLYPIMSASGINGYHSEYKIKAPGVTTGRSGLIGKVFYVMDNFWPLNTSLFIVEYKIATPLFSYFFLKTLDLEALNAGSAVPSLNRNDVHSLPTKIPKKQKIEDFEKIVQPLFEKKNENISQIRTLTQLRDTLLPKLMSGEITVSEQKVNEKY